MDRFQIRFYSSVAAIVCLIAPLFFQNCGKSATSNRTDSSSFGGSPIPLPGPAPLPTTQIPGPVGTANYLKGELFNYDFVTIRSQMVQTLISELSYYSYNGPKAIAVSGDGLGMVIKNATSPQTDVDKAALEGCFAISGGQPCALLASGYNFAVNKFTLPTSYKFTISVPPVISAATLPFVSVGKRAQLAAEYNLAPTPKALAVSVDGAYAWVSNTTQLPILSIVEARRLALERCEMIAVFSPCTLFALDNGVVFTPALINRAPQIEYLRATMANNIPGMRDQVFTTNMIGDYLPKVVNAGLNGAMYITADGRGGYATNAVAATADADALAACNAGKLANPCFRYAINQTVQNIASNLMAVKSYSLNTHCKSVPRQTCAHHSQMGCPAGNYYTTSSGAVSLENCP